MMPFGKTISHNVSNYINPATPSNHKSAFMHYVEKRQCRFLNINTNLENSFTNSPCEISSQIYSNR